MAMGLDFLRRPQQAHPIENDGVDFHPEVTH
jgi:hypothetical protein